MCRRIRLCAELLDGRDSRDFAKCRSDLMNIEPTLCVGVPFVTLCVTHL